MKTFRKAVSMLLVVCMAIGCMTIGAFAASEVTTSAFGQSTYPTVSGNYADTVYAKASVDVGGTVTDSGSLVLYSSYGLCTVTNWDYIGDTKVTSNNPDVATAEISYSDSTLNVAITGVSDGTATITVDYCGETTVNSNQIYSGTNGVANGYIKYTVTVGSGTSSGSGSGSTEPDPTPSDGLTVDTKGRYVIYNQADLEAVADDLTADYILANDIELTGNWTPLGWTDNDDVAFTGTFDGNGYTISGLNADWSDYSASNVGLFAINAGTIKNFSLVIGDIGGDSCIGTVAGLNNGGTISNVTVTQNTALDSGNGVTGLNDSSSFAGGIVGKNSSGIITKSSAKVSVYGYYFVGGLVGGNFDELSQCYCKGSVNNTLSNSVLQYCAYIGGLVGGNKGSISDCYSYTSGEVKGNQYVGGAVGGNYSAGSITNVWVDPYVMALNTGKSGVFCGSNDGSTTQSYVVSKTTGAQGGATRITSENLQDQTTFPQTATNWDWDNVWTWSNKYPVLRNCGNSGEHEDIVLPSTSTEVTVTFAAGDVREGDNVTLPTPNPVTVTVPADGEGSLVLEQDASRTSVVECATWEYRFIGWSDGKTVYDLGDTVEVTEDITLNAVWKLYTVDGDKDWSYLDAMAIMDYLAGNMEFYSEQIEVADYDNDDSVSYLDAMAIMDVLAGTTT